MITVEFTRMMQGKEIRAVPRPRRDSSPHVCCIKYALWMNRVAYLLSQERSTGYDQMVTFHDIVFII